MDSETVMRWLAALFLIWCGGAGMHWWRGPLGVVSDVWWDVRSRHETGRSDPDPTSDDDTGTDVGTTPREGSARRVPADAMRGPQELDDLLGEPGTGDEDDDEAELPRHEWVARRIADGWRPKDIDEEGAELYGCSTQTIFRERKALAKRGRGTMGGRS